MPFSEGDVAVLKSGGPLMTVSQVGPDSVGCVWFEKNNQKHGVFKLTTLELYEEEVPTLA